MTAFAELEVHLESSTLALFDLLAELHVSAAQIRKKLEPTPERPRYFITEPGIGYRLEHTTTNESAP